MADAQDAIQGFYMTASSAIARLRELRSKAYKGKWSVNGELGIEGERSSATDYDPLVLGGLKGGRGYIEYPHYSLYSQPTKTEGKANAAAIVAAMNALPALLECAEALELLVTSIDAAQFEGLHDAIAGEDAERMKDLLTRRILHHEHDARAALDALSQGETK